MNAEWIASGLLVIAALLTWRRIRRHLDEGGCL